MMVFDEVDSGIGGAVSSAVGERLKRLAKSKQVIIVVTHSLKLLHSATITLLLTKIGNNKSKIELKKLNSEEKLNEIARMLSGKEITDEAVDAANSFD